MTEDEAHERLCFNLQPAPGDGWSHCVASACMAWRWGQKPNPSYNPVMQGVSWPPPHPPIPMYVRDTERGGCGLAGAPQ